MKTRLGMISSLVFLAFFLLGSQPAFARYPDPGKIVTIICPVSAGGSTGTQLRSLAPEVEKHLGGASIRVEHIVGAAGKICYEKGYKSKPDGYTIMNYNLPAPIVTEIADKATRYKTSDFVPIYAVSTSPNILAVHAETWKTLDEFLREA